MYLCLYKSSDSGDSLAHPLVPMSINGGATGQVKEAVQNNKYNKVDNFVLCIHTSIILYASHIQLYVCYMCIHINVYTVKPLYPTTSTDRPLPYVDRFISVLEYLYRRSFNSLNRRPPYMDHLKSVPWSVDLEL